MSLTGLRILGWVCLIIGWTLHLKFNLPYISLLAFAIGLAAFVSIVVEQVRRK